MLKANAAASRKAGGSAVPAGHTNPATAAASGRVPLLQLTSLAPSSSKGGGGSSGKETFAFQSPQLSALRSSPLLVVDVWASNLRQVFDQLASVVDEYPYVAMDTEFPGVVARPLTTPPAGAGKASMDAYRYATIKCNVELLRMLQLGLCFCNEHGEIAARTPNDTDSASAATGVVFQFHFKFNLDSDLYASDSIELLQQSGLDLARHGVDGIDVTEFAELLLTSGIVLNDEVRWLTFHAGFDFAYLLHVLLGGGQGGSSSSTGNVSLPASEQDFFELISLYFPCIFDVKSLVRALPAASVAAHPSLASEVTHGGLDRLASRLGQARLGGGAHQAGSDSLLTAAVFFKLREVFFQDLVPPTVAQLQQRQQAASATESGGKGDDAASSGSSSSTSPSPADAEAALTAYAQREEQYLNHLFGLSSLANALLRAQRDKERSQQGTGAGAASASDTNEPAQTTNNTTGATGTAASRGGRNDRD